MKKLILTAIALTSMLVNAKAQITNYGFENWTTVGTYEDPTGWGTMNNLSTGSFHSCTKSTDHYPASVGNYSIRLENNTALTQMTGSYGMAITGGMNYPIKPAFAVTGHPTSLTGYYKYFPLNNDSLWIQVFLFNAGVAVSTTHINAVSTPAWTSFNFVLDNYTTADSATIILSAFYPSCQTCAPKGNSVLYVDNLNFDNLIVGVPETSAKSPKINLYPNPTADIITLNIENTNLQEMTANIYDVLGNLVSSQAVKQGRQKINTNNLENGIYIVEIRSGDWSKQQRMIVQR